MMKIVRVVIFVILLAAAVYMVVAWIMASQGTDFWPLVAKKKSGGEKVAAKKESTGEPAHHAGMVEGGRGVGMDRDAVGTLSSTEPLIMKEGEMKVIQMGTDSCPHCAHSAHDNKEYIKSKVCVYYDVMKVDVEKMLSNYPDLRSTIVNDLKSEPGIPKFYIVRCVGHGDVRVEDKILGYDKSRVVPAMQQAAKVSASKDHSTDEISRA